MANHFLVLIACFLLSCYQKIDFDISREEYLIVDATIIANSLNSDIILNYYDSETGLYQLIQEAEVYLENQSGDQIYFEFNTKGFYAIQSKPDVSDKYRLVIKIADEVYSTDYESFGKKFSENYELELEVSEEAYYTQQGSKEIVNLLGINLVVAPKHDSYAMFDYEGIYEVEDSVVGLAPADTCWYRDFAIDFLKVQSFTSGQKVELAKLLPSTKHAKYNLFVKEYSISERAFMYWSEMQKIRNTSGGIYDPPPSILYGNIKPEDDKNSPKVLGYFTLARYDSIRLPFSAKGLLSLSNNCDPKYYINTPNPIPAYCFTCELHPLFISKNVPPTSWIDP